jgi:crossover junction endodeoxyribonuclease RusA
VTWELDLFVPGFAKPQGSKRHVGHGVMIEMSKDLGPWRDRVGWFALQARPGTAPIERLIPVILVAEFVMRRPVATPKRSTPPAIRSPDLDKLVRSVGDALTGIAWIDDAQLVSTWAFKRIADLDEATGVHIRVGKWPSDQICALGNLGGSLGDGKAS